MTTDEKSKRQGRKIIPGVTNKIIGNNVVLCVSKNAIQWSFGSKPEGFNHQANYYTYALEID